MFSCLKLSITYLQLCYPKILSLKFFILKLEKCCVSFNINSAIGSSIELNSFDKANIYL